MFVNAIGLELFARAAQNERLSRATQPDRVARREWDTFAASDLTVARQPNPTPKRSSLIHQLLVIVHK